MQAEQTLAEYLSEWLREEVEPTAALKTYIAYEGQVRNHIIPALGHIKLTELTHRDVQGMLNGLTRVIGGRPLGEYSIHQTMRVLRGALELAYVDGLVDRNVGRRTKTPPLPNPDVKTWTPAQARTFLDYVEHHRLYALYAVTLSTALPQAEAMGLRWRDVDLDEATLTRRQQLQYGKLVILKPRRGRGKTVAIPQFTVDALRAHRERQLAEESTGDMELVFTGWNGRPLTGRALRTMFNRHTAEAGLPRIKWHAMRHFVATFYANETTVPTFVAARLIGHSPKMLELYSQTTVEHEREAVELMDAALRPVALAGG